MVRRTFLASLFGLRAPAQEEQWVEGDGRRVLAADYPKLASKLGVQPGAETFTLPDLRGGGAVQERTFLHG